MEKKDGTKAKFTFTKPKGSIWYWDIEENKSLPLPNVELKKAETLKECLKLIEKQRGEDWVGQVVVGLLSIGDKP